MRDSFWNSYNRIKVKSKPKFRVSYIIIIVLLSFVICFSIYMVNSNNNINNVSNSGTNTSVSSSSISETEVTVTEPIVHEIANPVPENASVDVTYLDSCVFIGDSITTGLSGYGFVPEKNVLAGTGMNIDKINEATITTPQGNSTIIEALKAANPQNVYIMLGSNGIAWMTNETMVDEYGEFIDEIKDKLPDSKIYIMSIPPVTTAKETDEKGAILNSDIDSYNSELLKMADRKRIYFIDINTALKGNDGKLPSDSAGKDGMHFKKDTYQIVLDYILKHTAKE